MRHAFVIPAYRQSPYLEACIESLRTQDETSELVITTATPSAFLHEVARRHDVPLIVGRHPPSIASDWNFALAAPDAELVTLAHQDDLFDPAYGRLVKDAFLRQPGATLCFTGHREHTPDGPRPANVNLLVKRWLSRRAFGSDRLVYDQARKRRLLKWGNPVCCPSVTFNRALIPEFRFAAEFQINLDWDAWARLATADGGFLYLPQPLVSHRVHPGSETTAGIADQRRSVEDLAMLRRFWPPVAARCIHSVYRLSYRANRL
ncbi:MAG: glycosyltransferase [Burkholderiaceae bacterium]